MFPFENTITGAREGKKEMNKYIILIKHVHQIAPFGGYISNFLHVWGGTSPSDSILRRLYPSNWKNAKQNYWKKGNEQEVHLFSLKKSNKSTKSLYLKHLLKIFFILIVIDRQLCTIKDGDDINTLGTIATFAPSDWQGWLRACLS